KGHYMLLNIDGPGPAIAELERTMRINEDILRYLTLRVDQLEEGPSPVMQNRGGREDRPRRDRDRYGEGRERFGEPRDGGERPPVVAPAAAGAATEEAAAAAGAATEEAPASAGAATEEAAASASAATEEAPAPIGAGT